MASRGVCNLKGADALIAADYLPVSIFDRGDIGFPESSPYETKDQGAFPNPCCSEHNHPVIIALFRHVYCAAIQVKIFN